MDLTGIKDNPLDRREQQEVTAKRQDEYRFIGSIRHRPGLTLFEIDKTSLECRPAAISAELCMDTRSGGTGVKRRSNVKQGCFYIEALNRKNALRKYLKLINTKTGDN
jgi:hypothetical protein